MIESDGDASSDGDNVPLAALVINNSDKVQNNSGAEGSIKFLFQQENDDKSVNSKLNPRKDKDSKRKVLNHKNKKKTKNSDSEDSDSESYTYFSENRSKKKIKLKSDLSNCDIIKQIKAIKIENICLEEENERINKIKLKERMMLRMEIKRLKSLLMGFNLSKSLKRELFVNVSNTTNFIRIVEKYLNETSNSQLFSETDKEAIEKYKSLKFTDLKFWNDFNNIEFNDESIYSKPLWSGRLDVINPNSESYFEPDKDIIEYLKISEKYFDDDNFTPDDICNITQSANDLSKVLEHVNNAECIKSPFNDCDSSQDSDNEKYDQNEYLPLSLEEINFTLNIPDCELERNEIHHNVKGDIDIEKCSVSENSELLVNDNATADINENANVTDDICNECGQDILWSSFIKRHREAYQKEEKLAPCHTCNMRFLKSGHFDGRHRLKRPPVKKFRSISYICDICGQGLTSSSGLSQHRLKHSDIVHSCPICDFKCSRKGYIKIHMKTHSQKSNHSNIYETRKAPQSLLYFCNSCDYTAETYKLLKLHKAVHKGKKDFACKQCPYSTNKSSAFIQHERVHTKEKPYQCPHCTYKSSTKSYLKAHMRYHTGEKPFNCDQCSYSCVTSTRLSSHKRTHITEKPFKCESCNCKFITKYELQVHSKKHEMVKTEHIVQ